MVRRSEGDGVDREPMATRIVTAATELFAERGIDGTSLQMIADRLGVAKAGVYYYFKTKEDLVGTVYAEALDEFFAAIGDAEVLEVALSRSAALDMLIPRLVALAVRGRRTVNRIHFDPVILRLTAQDDRLKTLRHRFDRLLAGREPDAEGLVRAAVFRAAIASAVVQPTVDGIDDETLREQLSRTLWDVVAPTLPPSRRPRRVSATPPAGRSLV
jgi:AcrR family transcriptional regulator